LVKGQISSTGNESAYEQNQLAQDLVNTYAQLIRGRPMAAAVVDRLRLNISPVELQRRLVASTTTDTSLLTLRATSGSRAEARLIAQTVADEFVRRAGSLATPDSGQPSVTVTVVEPASLPGAPIEPRPLLNLGVGALLGFLVGLAIAVLRNKHDKRVRSADDVRQSSGMTVLATVPRTRRPVGPAGPDLSEATPVTEAYRQLRTRVLSVDRARPHSLLVTSPVAGDGKTITACYLAATLARADHQVILVDSDLRTARVGPTLGLPAQPGLVEVLSQQATLEDAVQAWGDGQFDVLAAGGRASEPGELLAGPAMVALVQQLVHSYDFVILDSPPVTAFADAEILSALADQVLMVLRHGATSQTRLAEAAHNLSLVNASLMGAVITRAPRRAARYAPPEPSDMLRVERSPHPAAADAGAPERELHVVDGKQARPVGVARVPEARRPRGPLRRAGSSVSPHPAVGTARAVGASKPDDEEEN
jgi:receptor protein-tyrosine kinase